MQKNIKLITFVVFLGASFACQAKNVAYLFAHGLYSNRSLAGYHKKFIQDEGCLKTDTSLQLTYKSGSSYTWPLITQDDANFWIIQAPVYSFNFPDALRGYDANQTSLGQKNEINALANAYEKIKGNEIVLMGMSRGASTILTFLGTHNHEHVVAVVLESPFDSILNTLNTHCGAFWLGFLPVILHTSPNVLFGKFDRNGVSPIQVIDKINKDLPILIIASLQDTFIPALNTASIYLKFLENNYDNVYFLLVDHGVHGYLLEDNDTHLYLNTVHAFYKKQGLPYNRTFAAQGDAILAQCHPSKELVQEAIKNKKSFIKQ